ncbi:hypothetical protein BLA29_008887 [Euroglyphus maynei]|uniref:ZP domain-containing protein n=1 Tax=Euroglyphus maynei TaxID=6958 RepID=A0A1Y3BEU0_EURMA|nr:hypothetical protein BLA29_008887 [Euroglyphus maynei]
MLTLNFDSPFMGRVYTKSNPSQCFVNGNGQLQLQFAIPLDSRCGTYQESTSSYVNEVIVQQHSVIMTDNDRTIRVLCSFEISDQTITLGNIEQQKNVPIPNGIDVSYNKSQWKKLYGQEIAGYFCDEYCSSTINTNAYTGS